MTLERTIDKSQYMETFGTDVTIYPTAGSPISCKGIFDQAYVETLNTANSSPMIFVNIDDITSNVVYGCLVDIDQTDYSILSREDDGTGFSLLVLTDA